MLKTLAQAVGTSIKARSFLILIAWRSVDAVTTSCLRDTSCAASVMDYIQLVANIRQSRDVDEQLLSRPVATKDDDMMVSTFPNVPNQKLPTIAASNSSTATSMK
jgi:hypothetical protein